MAATRVQPVRPGSSAVRRAMVVWVVLGLVRRLRVLLVVMVAMVVPVARWAMVALVVWVVAGLVVVRVLMR